MIKSRNLLSKLPCINVRFWVKTSGFLVDISAIFTCVRAIFTKPPSHGLKKEVIFQIPNLFDSQNLPAVQRTLFQVGSLAQKNGFKGAIVGARMSSSNRRDFTDEVLRQAEMEPTKIAGGSNWSQKNTAGV